MNPLAQEDAKDVKSALDFYFSKQPVNGETVFLKGNTYNTSAWQQAYRET